MRLTRSSRPLGSFLRCEWSCGMPLLGVRSIQLLDHGRDRLCWAIFEMTSNCSWVLGYIREGVCELFVGDIPLPPRRPLNHHSLTRVLQPYLVDADPRSTWLLAFFSVAQGISSQTKSSCDVINAASKMASMFATNSCKL